MGLDLWPLPRPKPGREAEWAKLMKTVYAGKEETAKARKRRDKISIQPHAAVGAPRIGYDKAATAWALKNWPRKKEVSDAALIRKLRGYYAIELLVGKCDGIPVHSHGQFGIVDETSFRGSFLEACRDVLSKNVLIRAWTTVMRPEEAVAYGEELLALAKRAAAKKAGKRKSQRAKKPAKAKRPKRLSLRKQVDIVRTAGRWYAFWGKLGHPIWAYC